MQKPVIDFIFYACNIPPVIASLLTLFNLKRIDSRLYSFNLFLVFNGIVQVSQLIILNVSKSYHLLMFHIDVPIEFMLLAHFYYSVLKKYLDRTIYFTLVTIFISLSIINSIFIQPIYSFNSYALVCESTILIILSIFTFIVLLDTRSGMKKNSIGNVVELINSGIFIYFSASLFIYYFSNSFTRHNNNINSTSFVNQAVSYIFICNSFLAACMFSCFIIAMSKHIKQNGSN